MDPLTLSDLVALTGEEAVAAAAAAGAVRMEQAGGGDPVVHPGHPLYTDTVRTDLAAADTRRLRTAVADRLSARPPGDVIARLRLATLALDSDTPQPVAEVTAAALEALRLGDWTWASGSPARRWTVPAGCPRGWRWRPRSPGRAGAARPTRCSRPSTPRSCRKPK